MNKTTISLNTPTPMWARKIVRGLTWITALWALLMVLGVDLKDFGVSDAVNLLVLKYMAILTGGSSTIARFIGVEPVKLD